VVLDGALAFANADASVVEVGTDKSVYLAAGAGGTPCVCFEAQT
jgi:hypothetical protein